MFELSWCLEGCSKLQCCLIAGPVPAKLHLGRFQRPALRNAATLSRSLAATATGAAAQLLCLLQHHKAQGTKRVSLASRGVHTAGTQPKPRLPLEAIIGHSAALGVCKCLPYELPSISNEPVEHDPASVVAMTGGHVDAEQADMYGVAVSANTVGRPLMLYRSSPAGAEGGISVSSSSAYVITGKASSYHPSH